MFDSEVEGFVARMLLAVTYALTDAINVLLIGVLVVIGVLLPPRSRYNRTCYLLIARLVRGFSLRAGVHAGV